MEDTPTECADDLPTILGIFKNDPKSRSVNICFSGWILPKTVYKMLFTSQSSAIVIVIAIVIAIVIVIVIVTVIKNVVCVSHSVNVSS